MRLDRHLRLRFRLHRWHIYEHADGPLTPLTLQPFKPAGPGTYRCVNKLECWCGKKVYERCRVVVS
jgi:hypothetical protein